MAGRAPSSGGPTLGLSQLKYIQRFLGGIALLLAVIGGSAVIFGGGIYVWVEDLRGFALGVVISGGVLLGLALASSLVQVRAAVTGRRGRYAANAIVMVAAMLGITILINYIGFSSPVRWDTTASKQFSLSTQTTSVLEGLEQSVRATAFFVPSDPNYAADRQLADDLLFEFKHRSRGKFTYRFVDPEAEPSVVRQYNLNRYPAIIFETEEPARRFPIFVPVAEENFTSALLIVTGEQQKKVYFLTGHTERDIDDLDLNGEGFGFAARGLQRDNYEVGRLNLKEGFYEGKMPEDAAVLVVAGPRRLLLPEERDALLSWLKDGGRAVFLLDPDSHQSFKDLLGHWGIIVGDRTLVDEYSSVTGDPRTPLLQSDQYLGATPITDPLDVTFFPGATPLGIPQEFQEDPRKQPPWVQYLPLASTSFVSWATSDLERNTFRAGEDQAGPLPLAMAMRATSTLEEEPATLPLNTSPKVTSLVVIGDSDFATNRYFPAFTNGDLLLNTVNWLAEDYSLIALRPKPVAFRALVLTRGEFDFIRYSSWFLLPAVVALLGVIIWWRRR